MFTHTATITKLTRAIKRDPQNREHLFQTLLHRTFDILTLFLMLTLSPTQRATHKKRGGLFRPVLTSFPGRIMFRRS